MNLLATISMYWIEVSECELISLEGPPYRIDKLSHDTIPGWRVVTEVTLLISQSKVFSIR